MIPKSEVNTRKYLERKGYSYIRAGRSFGVWDFVAFNTSEILLIQAKYGQGPRSAEMARLKAFRNHPKINCVKKQIWLWKRYGREPVIKDLKNGG